MLSDSRLDSPRTGNKPTVTASPSIMDKVLAEQRMQASCGERRAVFAHQSSHVHSMQKQEDGTESLLELIHEFRKIVNT